MRLATQTCWLTALADPEGELCVPDRIPPRPWWDGLEECGAFHGILPAVRSNLARLAAQRQELDALAKPILQQLDRPLRLQAAVQLMLRADLKKIQQEAAGCGLPIAAIKGPAAADDLYPSPALRVFTDLDLLVQPQSYEAASDMLREMGYEPIVEHRLRHGEPYGQAAFRRLQAGLDLRVELHQDVVNSPAVRRGVSVGYADLRPGDDGSLSLEAHLIVAAVHGATSHQFDRLKFLVDVWQIVRKGAKALDIVRLRQLVECTGAQRSLAMACRLTQSVFRCAAAKDVAEQVGVEVAGLDRLLLSRSVVLPSRALCRTLRKQLYRSRLKKGGGRCGSC